MSIINLDPQANGWRDDGTESGVVRTEQVGGDLVSVPFPTQGYIRTISGAAVGSFQSNHAANPDGSGNAFWMNVSATGGGVRCFIPFRGATFGIRYLIPAASTLITVGVDGQHVPIDLAETAMLAESTTFLSTEGARLTHRDLDPDILHMAEITMVYGGAYQEATLYGFLLDRTVGYAESPPRLTAREAMAVTTARTSMNIVGSTHMFGCIQGVIYHNTTASPITVTISTAGSTTIAAYTIPASATEIVNFGGCVAAARQWYHAASAVGVNATILGGAL